MPRPPLATTLPERIARTAIGFVAGGTIGLFLGGFLAALCAVLGLINHPDPWPQWIAKAASVFGALWLAQRGPRLAPLHPRPPHRRRPTTGHGWVDLVFRMGLGVASGVLVGVLTSFTWLAWLPRTQTFDAVWDQLAVCSLLVLAGMVGGFVWYAFDFPWFAPRRPSLPHRAPSDASA